MLGSSVAENWKYQVFVEVLAQVSGVPGACYFTQRAKPGGARPKLQRTRRNRRDFV
jgi:hypothetical protein